MGAEAYTYADNLEWVTDDFSANRTLATAVLQFLDAWRLPISPSKCWCWATTPNLRRQWTELWTELFPDQEAQVQVVAKDLGFEVLYGAQLRHATLEVRFSAAYDKLHRMAKLPISILHKASMVLMSVLPTALHGMTGTYIGQRHFNKLRGEISHAVLGKHAHASHWLVCALAGADSIDPEWYYLSMVVRQFVTYLRRDCDRVQELLDNMDACNGSWHTVKGPATACASALARLGWSRLRQGVYQPYPGVDVDLVLMEIPAIMHFAERSWNELVYEQVLSTRKRLHDLDPPDFKQT